LRDRDIYVAPQEREEQQGEDVPMADPYSLVGVFDDADLDQDNQEDEEEHESEEKRQRDRKIVILRKGHRSSIP
jgi:rhodanese-related sulfurtransferase